MLIGIVAYLLVQFALGMFVSRRIASESDYLLAGRKLVVAPGAFDRMSARLVERAGFDAVYVTGSGSALANAGRADSSRPRPPRTESSTSGRKARA